MAEITLRAATKDDFPAIRELIRRVNINPMALDWRRFVLAVDSSNNMLGCGQLKPHGRHLTELASIAVVPEARKQGVARTIIDYLIAQAPRPLYLTCRSSLGPFYQRWGFAVVPIPDMPVYYRRLARVVALLAPLAGEHEGMLVMELK
jgi:N-acetylglutamate synthase-like GNAT family acetyltransferase